MYCPKCGKENLEDARFCMHCGADLAGAKVEISPNINVSPKIEVKTSSENKEGMCAICGEQKAVAICSECHRKVCDYHFEEGYGLCTLCLIKLRERKWEKWCEAVEDAERKIRENDNYIIEAIRRDKPSAEKLGEEYKKEYRKTQEMYEKWVEDEEKWIRELKRKLYFK